MYCNQNITRNEQQNKIALSDDELELIQAIRNYNNSYPNGYPQLLFYAQQLFDRLTSNPKD